MTALNHRPVWQIHKIAYRTKDWACSIECSRCGMRTTTYKGSGTIAVGNGWSGWYGNEVANKQCGQVQHDILMGFQHGKRRRQLHKENS